ncbi:MAG: hypothetical protein IT223_11680 [Crocinitomicaceae bacterium]|nr:hypothetical protein [Crocinitomicaceae bacterium]
MTHRSYLSSPDKIEQVKECISRLETGWNHKNTFLWVSAFTDPCEYVDGFGRYHSRFTHEQNARLNERAWNSVYANSRALLSFDSIEFYHEHLAVLIVRCMIDYEIQSTMKEGNFRITAIIEKHGQEWFIRHYHNTPVR